MSTWTQITETGRGKVRYRLMIEGWPDEFVTDTAITHATNADGRSVHGGLLHAGLRIHDRIVMHEARIIANGITFKIRPPRGSRGSSNWTDPVTASFSTYSEPEHWLGAAIDEDDTTITIEGSGVLVDGQIYYMGTETFRHIDDNTIERTIWDSLPQAHPLSLQDVALSVPIYTSPPSMDGRRVFLYVYGEDDDVAGDGECIWRGVVSRPPMLDADGMTWSIPCQPITHILKQQIAAQIQDARPIGILHSNSCAMILAMSYNAGAVDRRRLAFFSKDVPAMLATINAQLEDMRTSTGANADFDAVKLEENFDGGFNIHISCSAVTAEEIKVGVSSLIIGEGESWIQGFRDRFEEADSAAIAFDGVSSLLTQGDWYFTLDVPVRDLLKNSAVDFSFSGAPVAPIGKLATAAKHPKKYTATGTLSADFNYNRIYIDQDYTALVGQYVWLSNVEMQLDSVFQISDAGVTGAGYNWIELSLPALPGFQNTDPMGYATSETTISLVRAYNVGTVADFVTALKSRAIATGNTGDSPFVTSADLTTWSLSSAGLLLSQLVRSFRFTTKQDLEKILSEECKYATHFMRIEADGRIGVAPLPTFTNAQIVAADHEIDTSTVLTPDGSSHGMWPKWEPQYDGRVTIVRMQTKYDGYHDEWLDDPKIFQDPIAISLNKSRGKSPMEIKPFSRFTPPSPLVAFQASADEQVIAKRYLSLFSRDYIAITVDVPFSRFPILTGDVVSITCPQVPDGLGNRGMTDRRGVCIERDWNLDPADGDHGRLTFLVPARPVVGYAPSAQITAQVNTSGNNWDLTCAVANALNVAMSTDGGGQCLEHFANGDFVRVVKRDAATPLSVSGTLSSTPNAAAGTVSVALGAAWTPGSDSWVLEFDSAATGHTTSQDRFCYVADSTRLLADGSGARSWL